MPAPSPNSRQLDLFPEEGTIAQYPSGPARENILGRSDGSVAPHNRPFRHDESSSDTPSSPHGDYDTTPAHRLRGAKLHNDWLVEALLARSPTASGGCFSVPYTVHRNGQRAFLKAMDYTAALQEHDPALALLAMTEAFIFERDLLTKCADRRLSRVVRMLDHGRYAVDNQPTSVVQYIIFEMADGDIRASLQSAKQFDLAWTLRAMHQAVAALRQLHSVNIAHQDIKPSNLLTFANKHLKVADLGRAFSRDVPLRSDDPLFRGDRTYAPPEVLYNDIAADWATRCLAPDMYMLGSLMLFLYTGTSMTHLLLARLSDEHRPESWSGSYENVLTYVRHAFSDILQDVRRRSDFCAKDIATILGQLCDPDPRLRGHPKERGENKYSLERYVARLDLLSRKAEWSFRTGTRP